MNTEDKTLIEACTRKPALSKLVEIHSSVRGEGPIAELCEYLLRQAAEENGFDLSEALPEPAKT